MESQEQEEVDSPFVKPLSATPQLQVFDGISFQAMDAGYQSNHSNSKLSSYSFWFAT